MSLISAISSMQAGGSSGPNAGSQPVRTAPPPGAASTTRAQPVGAAGGSTGGGATAETTQTASRVPPVIAARVVSSAAAPRSGGEGRPTPEADAAEAGARAATEAAESRRDAEQARKLVLQEVMSRIPVPVEAIPKLTGDVEVLRSIDARDPAPSPATTYGEGARA